jgi:hypothetical protein
MSRKKRLEEVVIRRGRETIVTQEWAGKRVRLVMVSVLG